VVRGGLLYCFWVAGATETEERTEAVSVREDIKALSPSHWKDNISLRLSNKFSTQFCIILQVHHRCVAIFEQLFPFGAFVRQEIDH
jgi:hypothetical protein